MTFRSNTLADYYIVHSSNCCNWGVLICSRDLKIRKTIFWGKNFCTRYYAKTRFL